MDYDVTIVGAGPAGSTTAKFLSEKGYKVLLIDKDKFQRDKPCGGGLPSRVLDKFEYVNNERFIEAYNYGGIAYSPKLKYKIEVKKEKPIIATTLRKKFDFELVKTAKDSGAVFQDGKCVTDVNIFDDRVEILLKDGGVIDSQIVVGADGVWSIVAKKTGLRGQGYKTGVCILQEFEVDEPILDDYFTKSRYCHVHSRFKDVNGYGWIFPKKRHLNIGIGGLTSEKSKKDKKINLLEYYKDYIKFLKKNEIIPEKLKKVEIKGGALPLYPLEKTYSNRTLLVGDAGGFINPFSGEGIYYAMASGEIAARVIAEALEKGKTNEEFLSKYQRIWKKEFGKDIKLIYKTALRRSKVNNEKIFKIVTKDKVLADLFMGVITGELSIQKYKWKIVRRYILCLIKNRFTR